jgi:hypothetical protein
MCNSSSRSYVLLNWEWWHCLNFAVCLQQSNAQSRIGNSLSQQVEICTADITAIFLLNHALYACKILSHLSLFDVHQAQYSFLYTNSNCFVLERFLVSMFNVHCLLKTQVSWQLHKLTSICQFLSSQFHWEQWKRMNFAIEFKTIRRIGVIKMEKIQKTWNSRPHWRSWYCPPQTSLRL